MSKGSVKVKLLAVIGLVVASIAVRYVLLKPNRQPAYEFAVAARKDLRQEVSVTGRVQSAGQVDLAFEKSGRVIGVDALVGDSVLFDQILVRLDDTELQADLAQRQAALESANAQLKQYQAALAVQQAKLDELKRGTRAEEIQVAQTKVDNAQKSLSDSEVKLSDIREDAEISLTNLYRDIPDTLHDSYTKAESAVRIKTAVMFDGTKSVGFTLNYNTCDVQAQTDSTYLRYLSELELEGWQAELNRMVATATPAVLDQALTNAAAHLSGIRKFLNRMGDTLAIGCVLSSDTIETYRTNLNAATANINTADSNINASKQDIAAQKVTNQKTINVAEIVVNDAQSALAAAATELTLKQAGSTSEQISAQAALVRQAEANIVSQAAQIRQAQANVATVTAQWNKMTLRSPLDGIVTQQEARIGEIVSAGSPVVSLISAAQFEIKSNVPEADIAKIALQQSAAVTLDAYGDDILYDAIVTKIDPAETIIENVPTYVVTFQFTKKDDRIRSGMTANLDVLTAERMGVIVVPQRAIMLKNGDRLAKIVDTQGAVREVPVKTGIRGVNGEIEILDGISEGDRVVTFVNE